MAEYLSYEETAAFIGATKWKGYKFLSSEDVYNNIVAIPYELYGEKPQEQLKKQESETVAATTKEISKASSVAKILNLVDNQKPAAIKDYVRNKFGRQLVRTVQKIRIVFSSQCSCNWGTRNQWLMKKEIYFLLRT